MNISEIIAAGVIEKYGSGIKRVHQVLADAGAPRPAFESVAGLFKVTIYPISENDRGGQKGGQKIGQKRVEGSRARILSLMGENTSVTRSELSDKLGIAQSAVEKHIAALKEDGLLRRVGGRKHGRWEVI